MNKKNALTVVVFLGIIQCSMVFFSSTLARAEMVKFDEIDNINVEGLLVISTCDVLTGDGNYIVDFSDINVNDIYANKQNLTKEFTIIAKNCEPGSNLRITFTGEENDNLPGFIKVNGEAKGIAIGLSVNGVPVKVNNHAKYLGEINDNQVLFKNGAYIQGEPNAIKEKNIVAGDFTATANFTLSYD